MINITCIYATARPSKNAMIGRPDDHIKLFLDSLDKQSYPKEEFEVIIADCYHKYQESHIENNTYQGKKYKFEINHIEIKSPWLDRGCWAGQAPWNHSITLAKGELLCFFGDCCEMQTDYLERIWNWYLNGYWAMSLVIYKKNGSLYYVNDKELPEPIPDSDVRVWNQGIIKNIKILREMGIINNLVKDSRWRYVESGSGTKKFRGERGGQEFHGYSAIPLKAILDINGFDENFDGDKSLGDTDTGLRLARAGFDSQLLLDKNIIIYENAHYGIPKKLLFYEGHTIRSNYSLMELNKRHGRYEANNYTLNESDIDFICEHAINWGFKDINQRDNPLFNWWYKNPPIFNLSEIRNEVQDNLEDGKVEIPEYYWRDI